MTKPKPKKLKLFFRVLYVFFRYNFFAAAGYYNRSRYSEEEVLWQSYDNLNLTSQQLVYVFIGAAAYIYDLENGYYGD